MGGSARLRRVAMVFAALFSCALALAPVPFAPVPFAPVSVAAASAAGASGEPDATSASPSPELLADAASNAANAIATTPEAVYDNPDLPEISAEAYILIDRGSGRTIASKNATQIMYPASTTKIMTAMLAIENGDMNQMMTATDRAITDIGADGSNIGIIAGEQMRLDNLLDALLVKSANETANIIADNLAESRAVFIAAMNQKAKDLGALSTNFVNTHGNHDPDHYTTAYDLALIADYAMDNPVFREYVGKHDFVLAPTNKHATWPVMYTTNQLLLNESVKDYSVTGVKTGYTQPAGYCIVATGLASESGMELLCVVLGVRGDSASKKRFNDATALLDYGFAHYEYHTFIRSGERVKTVSVLGGNNVDMVEAVADGELRLFLPKDEEKWQVSRVEYVQSEVLAPVERGDALGYVEYWTEGAPVPGGKVSIVAQDGVTESKNGARVIPQRSDSGAARKGLRLKDGKTDVSGVLPLMAAMGALDADGDGAEGADGEASDGVGGGGEGGSGGSESGGSGGDESGQTSAAAADSQAAAQQGSAQAQTQAQTQKQTQAQTAAKAQGEDEDGAEDEAKSKGGGVLAVLRNIGIGVLGAALLLSVIRTVNRARYRRPGGRGPAGRRDARSAAYRARVRASGAQTAYRGGVQPRR